MYPPASAGAIETEHAILTPVLTRRILNSPMHWIRFVCALLAIFVVALTVCPVPIGQGPFSAAYGPATKFQALQALLLLLFLLAAAIVAPSASVSTLFINLPNSNLAEIADGFTCAPPSVNSSLRC